MSALIKRNDESNYAFMQRFNAGENQAITRANIDALLDSGQLEVLMSNGRWWAIRRNGATRRWKRDTSRIYIPYKAGIYTYGEITESDFTGAAGSLYSNSGYRRRPA